VRLWSLGTLARAAGCEQGGGRALSSKLNQGHGDRGCGQPWQKCDHDRMKKRQMKEKVVAEGV
jgi:hypothetical protein